MQSIFNIGGDCLELLVSMGKHISIHTDSIGACTAGPMTQFFMFILLHICGVGVYPISNYICYFHPMSMNVMNVLYIEDTSHIVQR